MTALNEVPDVSRPAQRAIDEQEIAPGPPASEVHVGVAAVGFCEISRLVPASTRHSDVDGQDTALMPKEADVTCVTVQVGVASAGLVEINVFPWSSPATQSDVDTQETALIVKRPSTFVTVQVGVAAPGSVDVTTSP